MTAVEWLANEIEIRYGLSKPVILLIRDAKEMEKQQIIDAVNWGLKYRASGFKAEMYYNETFKKQ